MFDATIQEMITQYVCVCVPTCCSECVLNNGPRYQPCPAQYGATFFVTSTTFDPDLSGSKSCVCDSDVNPSLAQHMHTQVTH